MNVASGKELRHKLAYTIWVIASVGAIIFTTTNFVNRVRVLIAGEKVTATYHAKGEPSSRASGRKLFLSAEDGRLNVTEGSVFLLPDCPESGCTIVVDRNSGRSYSSHSAFLVSGLLYVTVALFCLLIGVTFLQNSPEMLPSGLVIPSALRSVSWWVLYAVFATLVTNLILCFIPEAQF